ncbi:transglycosylase SLT domain-containing protein [Lacrimispora defluvii]|uniref:Transglycosylase SLT domain-containing protein n=1 Tax=Lacrimispora defluvii TaxID=2719233 RepID=A0ABX1VQ16_9FIRM|nr:transglycosylase SLT domain-containing protein [Lacrimispora defluvii]NNJ30550.1 transglycosylase SLT domain-containing protein [Lacrimispora defluvii]
MATQCRSAKINRNKRMKLYANMILVLLVLIGGVLGFFLAKLTTPPQETITVTKTVEVPAYKSNVLVDTADVFLFDVPLSDSLQRYIYEICADENVPVTLVMAMIEHESGFDPEAVSPTDDYGLMQINAVNHEWLKEEYRCADMMNPYQNVFCGISIISSYIDKYGELDKALMAYNKGNYGAQKAWKNGVTSIAYSEEILSLMKEYEEVSNATGN